MSPIGIVIIFIALVLIFMFLVFISSTPKKQYENAIKTSAGLNKVRFLIRKNNTYFANKFMLHDDEKSASKTFCLSLLTTEAYNNITDTFYPCLKSDIDSGLYGDFFEELSTEIETNKELQLMISASVFGLALGIVISKASESEGAKIHKKAIDEYLDLCELTGKHRKAVHDSLFSYLDLVKSETKEAWAILEKLTYILMGADITRDKDDIANPIIIMPLRMAITFADSKGHQDDKSHDELKLLHII